MLAVTPPRDFEGRTGVAIEVLDASFVSRPGRASASSRSSISLPSHEPTTPGTFDAAADGADLRTTGPGGPRVHPGVMRGWDTAARRGAAYAFHGGNPAPFSPLTVPCSGRRAEGRTGHDGFHQCLGRVG